MSGILLLENFETWKEARELRVRISTFAKTLPSYERFRLSDQIIRSSRSVAANIAEGFGCYYFQEAAHYFRLARGSLLETLEHLVCACDEGYLSAEELQHHKAHIEVCAKLINGYIGHLKRSKPIA